MYVQIGTDHTDGLPLCDQIGNPNPQWVEMFMASPRRAISSKVGVRIGGHGGPTSSGDR
ncbi:hypothetical protein [Pseudonocardia endophytica]|uniref:Uncharacterized protein n=1 Tax=Pseudonocardia endophytica TaxID=401976 RepID=A0A4R1HUH7_PSEEN|nr:hypothetical protein [Pseudonocardia endophytica]TCK26354.1 hypothetical protein EV378_2186 [Pseudonocardia endophytica]